jgi:hypothetical protein
MIYTQAGAHKEHTYKQRAGNNPTVPLKTMSREEPFHRINEPVTKGKSCAADKNCKEGNASLADSTEDTTGEKTAHWALGAEIETGNRTGSRHRTPNNATAKPKHGRWIESPGGNWSNSEAVQTAVQAPEAHTNSGRRKSPAEKKRKWLAAKIRTHG